MVSEMKDNVKKECYRRVRKVLETNLLVGMFSKPLTSEQYHWWGILQHS